jgi:hypothetical protein
MKLLTDGGLRLPDGWEPEDELRYWREHNIGPIPHELLPKEQFSSELTAYVKALEELVSSPSSKYSWDGTTYTTYANFKTNVSLNWDKLAKLIAAAHKEALAKSLFSYLDLITTPQKPK